MLAHQTEAMARQKILRPLPHYLRPPKQAAKGDATVLLTPKERAQLRKIAKERVADV